MHNFRNMQWGKVMLKLKAVVGHGSFLHWYWQYGGDVHAVFWFMQWYEWCFICGDDGWLWWESCWGVPWSQRVSGKQYYATRSLFYFPIYYQHQSIPNNLWVKFICHWCPSIYMSLHIFCELKCFLCTYVMNPSLHKILQSIWHWHFVASNPCSDLRLTFNGSLCFKLLS